MSAQPHDLQRVETPTSLLAIAVQNGADVEKLGKLMELQQRWDAELARKAYFGAKGKFQSLCPTINKDKTVRFSNTEYKHASLGGIVNQIRVPLAECGLTYRWEIDDSPETIKVTCILSHQDGHSEQNSMSACPDNSGAKNDIQQRGSTVTYLQRYTLIGVCGIATANDDDDGKASGALNIEILLSHNTTLREHFESVYVIKQAIATKDWGIAVEAWHELTEEEQRALWVAPTKGGIFHTKEREAMKSEDWHAARTIHVGTD